MTDAPKKRAPVQRPPKRATVEFYWCADPTKDNTPDDVRVNWRLVGANGEIMCQCTQGFRDKADAQRSVTACAHELFNAGNPLLLTSAKFKGPGRKPA